MKIIYFSLDYTPHDHRFLAALAETQHQVSYVRLQRGPRQTEDRPVPEKVEQVLWEGGREVFRWRDLPKYVAAVPPIMRPIHPAPIPARSVPASSVFSAVAGVPPVPVLSLRCLPIK